MSSKLTIPNLPFRTPQLKRPQAHQQALRTASGPTSHLPLHSRFQPLTTCLFHPAAPAPNDENSKLASNREAASTLATTLTDERPEMARDEVAEINEVFKAGIARDLQWAERRRERRGLGSGYEERGPPEEVWVGEAAELPRDVFEAMEGASLRLQESGFQGKINCLQGFLPGLGLFYYSIEETLMFFDADTISAHAPPICLLKLDRRALTALFEIQVLSLGRPYFEARRNVLAFLHPYEVEFYQFELKRRVDEERGKKLELKPLNLTIPMPEKRPNRLALSASGYLYTADNQGRLFKIDFQDYFWRVGKRELQVKVIKPSLMSVAYFKYSARLLSASISNFCRTVRNYGLSFFASKETSAEVLFDEEREIVVVFVRSEVRSERSGRERTQCFWVYDEKSSGLLYSLRDGEVVKGREEIVVVRRLELHPNYRYNFVLLLRSGRRVLLGLQRDRERRTRAIDQPPLNIADSSLRNNEIRAFFLSETLMGQLSVTNSCYLTLVRETSRELESATQLRLEASDVCFVNLKKSEPLGERKRILMQYEKSNMRIENWPEACRQVYFYPHEIYYSTDEKVQKVKVLRPVDLFFTLFTLCSRNVPDFFKKLKRVLPELTPRDTICLCCQILVDPEGTYFVTPELEASLESRNNFPKPWSSGELEEHCFKDIDREKRRRLVDIMVDAAVGGERGERQRVLVEGVLQYYCRLLRVVFLAKVGLLSGETCKMVSCLLQELRKLLLELQAALKCDLKASLGRALKWVNKFWQLMMLARDVPTLPDLTLDEAVVEGAGAFEAHIFGFLVRECTLEVFEQVKRLMPSFITAQFEGVYRLYCEVAPLRSAEAILDICRNHPELPDYFIDYLVKCKKIPEAVLLKRSRMTKDEREATLVTYDEKMKEFFSGRSTLYEKQQCLVQAAILLAEERKAGRAQCGGEEEELRTLEGQVKLQELMIEYYHERVANKGDWEAVLSRFLGREAAGAQERAVIDRLNTCLLERGSLGEVVEELGCALLRVMHTYYFDSARFEDVFYRLAESLCEASEGDVGALGAAFRSELHFMLVRARLAFSFQEVAIMLDAYITLLAQSPSLRGIISTEVGVGRKELYWPLCFAAEVGLEAGRLYEWGAGRLAGLERSSEEFLFTAACCCYLVKDYCPDRKASLLSLLRAGQCGTSLLQVCSLLS